MKIVALCKTLVVSTLVVFMANTVALADIVGSDTVWGKTYTYPGTRAMGMIITPSEDITITEMNAHVNTVSDSSFIRGIIYQKPTDGGHWDVVAVGDILDITADWNVLTFPDPVNFMEGETYLIAHITDRSRSLYYGDGTHQGGGRVWNANIAPFEDPESSGSKPVQVAYIYGAYADFIPTPVFEEPVEEPVEVMNFTDALDERVAELGLSYDPTGSVHAYPNLLKKSADGREVVFEGYIVDKLATLREGHEDVIQEAYIMIDDMRIEVTLNGAEYETSAIVPAVPGTEMSVSLYAIDLFGNLALVDSTRIKVKGIHPCDRIAKLEDILAKLEVRKAKLEDKKAKLEDKKTLKCDKSKKGKGHKHGHHKHGHHKHGHDKQVKKIDAQLAKIDARNAKINARIDKFQPFCEE